MLPLSTREAAVLQRHNQPYMNRQIFLLVSARPRWPGPILFQRQCSPYPGGHLVLMQHAGQDFTVRQVIWIFGAAVTYSRRTLQQVDR